QSTLVSHASPLALSTQVPLGHSLSTEHAPPALGPPLQTTFGAPLHVAPPQTPSSPQHFLVIATCFLDSAVAITAALLRAGFESGHVVPAGSLPFRTAS